MRNIILRYLGKVPLVVCISHRLEKMVKMWYNNSQYPYHNFKNWYDNFQDQKWPCLWSRPCLYVINIGFSYKNCFPSIFTVYFELSTKYWTSSIDNFCVFGQSKHKIINRQSCHHINGTTCYKNNCWNTNIFFYLETFGA